MAKEAFYVKHAKGEGSVTSIGAREADNTLETIAHIIRVHVMQAYQGLATAEKNAIRAITIGNIIDASFETETN